MQRTFTIIIGCLLIIFAIYHIRSVNVYKSEINRNKVEITNLKKEKADVNYNFGYTLAKTNCWTCHKFKYATDNLLEGVVQRLGEKYLSLFLTKQDSLISANDIYATELKGKYGNLANSHNFKFSSAELKAIIEFMKK
jgi:hypothetical protein